MKSQTSQARPLEQAEVERRRAAIVAVITERGAMTSAEIRRSVPGVGQSALNVELGGWLPIETALATRNLNEHWQLLKRG